MAENNGDPRDAQNIPMGGFDAVTPTPMAPAPISPGDMTVQTFGDIITAQYVKAPRNMVEVRRQALELAHVYGETLFYSWMVKKRQPDGTTRPEEIYGPTVDSAYALMGLWKNCVVRSIVKDEGTHTYHLARFVDHENGVTIERGFRQRKDMKLGAKMGQDGDRRLDIQFQIGESKAHRNAIVAGLKLLITEMIEEARKALVTKVAADRPKYDAAIDRAIQHFRVEQILVERYVAHPRKEWTHEDVARIIQAFTAIKDGQGSPQEIFGGEDSVPEVRVGETIDGTATEKKAEPQNEKPREAARKKPAKADAKPDEKKEPEKPREEPKIESKPADPGVQEDDLEQLAGMDGGMD